MAYLISKEEASGTEFISGCALSKREMTDRLAELTAGTGISIDVSWIRNIRFHSKVSESQRDTNFSNVLHFST